eukprot:349588-Chlamydomonas_euryale.AAC.9
MREAEQRNEPLCQESLLMHKMHNFRTFQLPTSNFQLPGQPIDLLVTSKGTYTAPALGIQQPPARQLQGAFAAACVGRLGSAVS